MIWLMENHGGNKAWIRLKIDVSIEVENETELNAELEYLRRS